MAAGGRKQQAKKRGKKGAPLGEGTPGRMPHQPSDDGRRHVMQMARIGVPKRLIAQVVGISEPTLNKFYAKELEQGQNLANVELVQTLYNMAVTDKHWPALNRLLSLRIPEFAKSAEDAAIAAAAAAAEAENERPPAPVVITLDLGPAPVGAAGPRQLPKELADVEREVIQGEVLDRQVH